MFIFGAFGELALGETPTAPSTPAAQDNSKGPPHAFGQFALGQEDDDTAGTTTLTVTAAVLTFSGSTVTATVATAVEPAVLEVSGQAVGLIRTTAVDPGGLSFSGQALTFGFAVGVDPASLTFTGQTIGLSALVPPTVRKALLRTRAGKPKFYWKGRT
jgi:hypothetical protein